MIKDYFNGEKFLHICECCGKVEELTAQEAFDEGWDYPPHIGEFGVLSPRTCGNCMMINTIWWAVTAEKKGLDELTDAQRQTIARVKMEPESLRIKGEGR